ncbi:MAG TPA: serine kinase [Candidatus Omnitrophica bacterium]|nr:serine kinase [Candidatus Omnitrophota bacterium]
MKLKEIVEKMSLEVIGTATDLDREVTGGYASDLLSDVLANAREGDLWITLQIHSNVVAVASMKGLSGIVLINNREPEEDTVKKAESENVPILVSKMPAFELVGKLYALGIKGSQDNA